jgi:hypothetical protein
VQAISSIRMVYLLGSVSKFTPLNVTVLPPSTLPYLGEIELRYGVVAISYSTSAPPIVVEEVSTSAKLSPSIVTAHECVVAELSNA